MNYEVKTNNNKNFGRDFKILFRVGTQEGKTYVGLERW